MRSSLCFSANTTAQYIAYRAIKSLPSILQSVFQVITEAMGWVFFISAGGPNPSDDSHIYMEK